MTQRHAGVLRVAALALLWGSSFLWMKFALQGLGPTQVVLARLALGAAALVAVVYLRGSRLPSGQRTWLHLFAAALIGNVVPYLLFAIAQQDLDSAVAGMLNATTPLWTLIIAVLSTRQRRPPRPTVVGLLLGGVGTAIIFAPWTSDAEFVGLDMVLCLAAAFSYALSYVYIGRFLATPGADPLAMSAAQLTAATALTIPILPAFNGLVMPTWTTTAVVSTLVLGVLGTGLAYVLNYRIIASDGPVTASLVIYLLPIVAITLGVLAADERLTAYAIGGTALVLAGVATARHAEPAK